MIFDKGKVAAHICSDKDSYQFHTLDGEDTDYVVYQFVVGNTKQDLVHFDYDDIYFINPRLTTFPAYLLPYVTVLNGKIIATHCDPTQLMEAFNIAFDEIRIKS